MAVSTAATVAASGDKVCAIHSRNAMVKGSLRRALFTFGDLARPLASIRIQGQRAGKKCNNRPMDTASALSRRHFIAVTSAAGLGQTLLPGALLALAAQGTAGQASASAEKPLGKITAAMIDDAAAIAGLTVTDEQKAMVLDGLNAQREVCARDSEASAAE